jgi:hypothetical protein
MNSKIADLIKFKGHAVAIILSDNKPDDGIQFKENIWGCVASMLSAAAVKGKTAFFDRKTFGCQSVLFSFAEGDRKMQRAIIGFFDLAARKHVDKNMLSFTIPYKMFLEMEDNAEGSFLELEEMEGIKRPLG